MPSKDGAAAGDPTVLASAGEISTLRVVTEDAGGTYWADFLNFAGREDDTATIRPKTLA